MQRGKNGQHLSKLLFYALAPVSAIRPGVLLLCSLCFCVLTTHMNKHMFLYLQYKRCILRN